MFLYDQICIRGRFLVGLMVLLLGSKGTLLAQLGPPLNQDSLRRISENSTDKQAQVDALLLLAESYMAESIIEVRRHAAKALELSRQIEYDLGAAKALGMQTWAARRSGDMVKAVDLGRQALDAAKRIGEDRLIANAHYELGAVVQQTNEYSDARRWFLAGKPYYERLGDKYGIAKSFNGIGESFRREKLFDSAMVYYDSAAVYFQVAQSELGRLIIRNNRAMVLYSQGQFQAAFDSAESAIVSARAGRFLAIILESGHTKARCWIGMGELEKAKEQAKLTLEEAQMVDSKPDVKNCIETLLEIAKLQKDFETALQYQETFYQIKEKIAVEAAQSQIENMDFELKMLDQQNEINNLQNDRRVRKLWQLLLVVLLGLVFVVFVVLATAYRRNRRSSLLLAQQNEQLADLNREKDSLVNIVAHDLKSPLSKVKALSAMLGMAGPLTEKQQQALTMMSKVVTDGERLIQDLLDISQAESTDIVLHYENGEANALITDWMAPHKENAVRKRITLEFHAQDHPIPIRTELNYLGRIFDNLLSNALKYTPSDLKVEVTSAVVGQKLHITVRDQGPGISQEDQEKMFKKFQRLSARPTGGESSTGLGLSIIKTLSQRLHGDILVESKLGEGSKFTLIVPLDAPKG
jgi:signal transduction histidine kinase